MFTDIIEKAKYSMGQFELHSFVLETFGKVNHHIRRWFEKSENNQRANMCVFELEGALHSLIIYKDIKVIILLNISEKLEVK